MTLKACHLCILKLPLWNRNRLWNEKSLIIVLRLFNLGFYGYGQNNVAKCSWYPWPAVSEATNTFLSVIICLEIVYSVQKFNASHWALSSNLEQIVCVYTCWKAQQIIQRQYYEWHSYCVLWKNLMTFSSLIKLLRLIRLTFNLIKRELQKKMERC